LLKYLHEVLSKPRIGVSVDQSLQTAIGIGKEDWRSDEAAEAYKDNEIDL